MSIPTVKIKSDHPEHGGHYVINESDYDPDTHELYQEPGSLPEGKAELIEQAAKLKLGAPSILARWSIDRLKAAIDESKASKD